MTAPMIPTNQRPWQQAGQGYDGAVQQQQGQPMQSQVPVQQQMPQLQQDVSPLSQVAPRAPVLPWEQGRQQQQPVQQQQVQQQQPFQVPQGVDLNAKLYGGNIPQELQGRTVGEMVGMLNGLRQVHLGSLAQPQNIQQPIQQAPLPGQQQQPQPGQPGAFDWRKPEESFGKLIDDRLNQFQARLGPMFAPVIQQGQINQAMAARNQVANEIPNFGQLEPLIIQRLQGIAPEALSNPETWRVAARVAIGDAVLRGQQPQQQQGQGVAQAQPAFPQQQVQMGQNPAPNYAGWFSETPAQGGQMQAPIQLSPQEMRAADAMNQSYADYAAWKVGVQAPSTQAFSGGRR